MELLLPGGRVVVVVFLRTVDEDEDEDEDDDDDDNDGGTKAEVELMMIQATTIATTAIKKGEKSTDLIIVTEENFWFFENESCLYLYCERMKNNLYKNNIDRFVVLGF